MQNIQKDVQEYGQSSVMLRFRVQLRTSLTETRQRLLLKTCTPEAIDIFMKNGVLYAPGKASNAGGVATSGLEMCQNSMRYSWSFEEVDAKLKDIMVNIFRNVRAVAKEYGQEDNLVLGANIAGFLKVANAMMAQGV